MLGTSKLLRSGSRAARSLRERNRFLLRVEELERRTLLAAGVLGSIPALSVLGPVSTSPAATTLNSTPALSAVNSTPANSLTNAATTTPAGGLLTPGQQTPGSTTTQSPAPVNSPATNNATSAQTQTGPNGQPNTTATQTQPFGSGSPVLLAPATGPTGPSNPSAPAASSPIPNTSEVVVPAFLTISIPAASPQVVGITPVTTAGQPTPLTVLPADLQGSPLRFYDGHTGDGDANNNIGFGAREEDAFNPDDWGTPDVKPPDNNQVPPLNPFTPGPATEPAGPANVPLFYGEQARPVPATDHDPWTKPAAVERYRLASVAEQETVASVAAVERRGLDVQNAVLIAGLAAFLETELTGEGTGDERADRRRRRVPRHVPA